MDQEEKKCNEVKTIREFIYLDNMVCSRCETAVTARTRFGWVEFVEYE